MHGDDGSKLLVTPRRVSEQSVIAVVPEGAASGKPSVISTAGVRTAAPVEIKVKPENAIADVEGFAVKRVEADSRQGLLRRQAQQLRRLPVRGRRSRRRADRRDLEEVGQGRRLERPARPGAVHQPRRSTGTASTTRAQGRPEAASTGSAISALGGGEGAGAGFGYYDHKFPLRGKHTYGDGLGAGRGHQGQDVFARCGKKLVAARGGRVQTSSFQSSAGYYLVIDGRKTGKDYVYMHMERRGRAKEGERVKTGEVIGFESDTGNASGCHLHFELWSAPGWYEGGHADQPHAPAEEVGRVELSG